MARKSKAVGDHHAVLTKHGWQMNSDRSVCWDELPSGDFSTRRQREYTHPDHPGHTITVSGEGTRAAVDHEVQGGYNVNDLSRYDESGRRLGSRQLDRHLTDFHAGKFD